jgi:hypothetical protein
MTCDESNAAGFGCSAGTERARRNEIEARVDFDRKLRSLDPQISFIYPLQRSKALVYEAS